MKTYKLEKGKYGGNPKLDGQSLTSVFLGENQIKKYGKSVKIDTNIEFVKVQGTRTHRRRKTEEENEKAEKKLQERKNSGIGFFTNKDKILNLYIPNQELTEYTERIKADNNRTDELELWTVYDFKKIDLKIKIHRCNQLTKEGKKRKKDIIKRKKQTGFYKFGEMRFKERKELKKIISRK